MKLTIAEIERAVCAHFRLTPEKLRGRMKSRGIVRPRQIIWYLAREMSEIPYPRLGRYYNRDHTTCLAGFRRIRSLIQTNPKVAAHVEACRALLPSVEAKLAMYRQDAELLRQGHISWRPDAKPSLAEIIAGE